MDQPTPTAAANLKRIMNDYYQRCHRRAAGGDFVVWTAIIAPVEILQGFDLVVAMPENHAAMCAARGAGASLARKAEERGYPQDLCSYARIDLGTLFAGGAGSPAGGLPRPNLLISDNNNCSLLVKWFDVIHRALGVPHFILDVPFCIQPQRDRDRAYIQAQYRDLIATIEHLTGQRWDPDRTRQAVVHTLESHRQWRRFLGCAAGRPSPVTAFDSFVHMGPLLTDMRGTPAIVDHFRLLADEAEGRARRGDVPVPGERHRLLWDNIAPWHQLRRMSGRLAALDANIVQATYTACIGTVEGGDELLDPAWARDPLGYLARTQNFSVCPYGLALRQRAMQRLIERFAIDGVVFASNRSCKVYSLMQMDLMRRIQRTGDVRTVLIDVDHADSRAYDEEKVFVQLEALLEALSPAG